MREYERVCRCCRWRYAPDGLEEFCGPCSRARGITPEVAHSAIIDADWRKASGHVCPLLWTLEEQRAADRVLARERRERDDEEAAELAERDKWAAYHDGIRIEREIGRWPDVQREEYEHGR